MELQLKIIGILLIGLAMIHLSFPKYFDWKRELQSISLINKQMMYVHTFFIAVIVFLMGLLCFFGAHDILTTRLGRYAAVGLFIFWGLRLFFQLFIYSPKLWRGKSFETSIHIIFSVLWLYLTAVFAYISFF
jgi:hypothetical protein